MRGTAQATLVLEQAILEIAENAPLRGIIERNPGNERGDHEHGHRIRGDDEIGMRPEIHGRAPANS